MNSLSNICILNNLMTYLLTAVKNYIKKIKDVVVRKQSTYFIIFTFGTQIP